MAHEARRRAGALARRAARRRARRRARLRRAEKSSDLWLVPADGSAAPRRLTFSKGAESGVAWSPDSRRIAFSANREGHDENQVHVLDIAGGGEAERVTNVSTGASRPVWRSDGQAILFSSMTYPGAMDDAENKKGIEEKKARK